MCEAPRYKDTRTQGKKIPHKVLRYFPLTPRLRRLYMSGQRAKDMGWYIDKRVDDGIMRHPANSEEWKEFDLQHPDFALEPRNVRLGLATYGFNLFGNMNKNYSMWPVILIPYNLPPWLVIKEPYFMLSLLIPGPHQPRNEIDIYLKPLVDELKELWEEGVETYDAYSKEHFQMRVTLLWTIHDYPGFGNVSGWRTKGYHSCYTCNDQPYSEVLKSKIGFINYRAYLPMEHRWRQSWLHNGLSEKRKRSLELQVEKIQEQLDRMPNIILGKHPSNKKKQLIGEPNWSKASILYKLPYWKNKKLKHNIDVMCVEKNISESTYGTLLGIEGKNKDINKARIDLQNMNFRHTLHLKQLKYPDGYAANISRSVNAKNGRLSGLKSHDCHVLLQRILPIGLRGFADKDISIVLFELGNFFQDLCSRTLKQNELEKLEERIVLILCKLERFFPPAFFDVMVHLAVHLHREAILGGLVQYRWMYPIERYLEKLKRYVSNRARPEGSIVKAYILKECINNWSLYIDGIETVHNRRERNEDFGESSEGLIMNRLKVNESSKATKQLWSLANGPKPHVKEYTVYNIIEYCMGDVETEVILEGGTSRDANQNEEYDIPDVDLDMDYDM
nr:uncharacterized protein LOC112011004 [Quercus suber]